VDTVLLNKPRRHWNFPHVVAYILLWSFFCILGPLNPEITVKYGAVSIIFLVSGLSIKLEELLGAVTNVKIHIFIQIFSQVFTPIFVKILTVFLWMIGVNDWILKGWVPETCTLTHTSIEDFYTVSFLYVLNSWQIVKTIMPWTTLYCNSWNFIDFHQVDNCWLYATSSVICCHPNKSCWWKWGSCSFQLHVGVPYWNHSHTFYYSVLCKYLSFAFCFVMFLPICCSLVSFFHSFSASINIIRFYP